MDTVNTDTSGGTRFSEGKGPLVGAPLYGLFGTRHLLWDSYCAWALDPRNPELMQSLIDRLREMVLDQSKMPPAQLVGLVAREGAKKYALLDWVEGQLLSTLVNSCGRHIEKHILGIHATRMIDWLDVDYTPPVDEESGLPHLGHALWNVLCWASLERLGEGDRLDDYSHLRGVVTSDKNEAGCCGVGCVACPLKEADDE